MISFVYFDVGGVVIDDFSGNDKWDELAAELGVTPDKKAQMLEIWDEYTIPICTTMDVNDLVPILNRRLGLALPDNYDLLDSFVRRFSANGSMRPIIASLQRRVKLGLLTNMYPRMLQACYRAGIMPNTRWDVTVDSSIVGLAKPDPDIFKLAQSEAKVMPGEILFVDNTATHLEAASALGWQTFLYNPADKPASNKALLEYLNINDTK